LIHAKIAEKSNALCFDHLFFTLHMKDMGIAEYMIAIYDWTDETDNRLLVSDTHGPAENTTWHKAT
jgi:hypothetical protein